MSINILDLNIDCFNYILSHLSMDEALGRLSATCRAFFNTISDPKNFVLWKRKGSDDLLYNYGTPFQFFKNYCSYWAKKFPELGTQSANIFQQIQKTNFFIKENLIKEKTKEINELDIMLQQRMMSLSPSVYGITREHECLMLVEAGAKIIPWDTHKLINLSTKHNGVLNASDLLHFDVFIIKLFIERGAKVSAATIVNACEKLFYSPKLMELLPFILQNCENINEDILNAIVGVSCSRFLGKEFNECFLKCISYITQKGILPSAKTLSKALNDDSQCNIVLSLLQYDTSKISSSHLQKAIRHLHGNPQEKKEVIALLLEKGIKAEIRKLEEELILLADSPLEGLAEFPFGPKSRLSQLDSDFSQIAYGQEDMSIYEKHEPASKSSNLGREANFASPSLEGLAEKKLELEKILTEALDISITFLCREESDIIALLIREGAVPSKEMLDKTQQWTCELSPESIELIRAHIKEPL